MGTNYYWRHNICTCCHRYDEQHICKSLTSFQAYFGDAEWDDTTKQFGTAPALIASWADWKSVLAGDGAVFDEYGDRIEVAQFIADVEATDPSARRRQYDWCCAHPRGMGIRALDQVVPGGDWLDADGFSFYGADFS